MAAGTLMRRPYPRNDASDVSRPSKHGGRSSVPANGRRNGRILMKFAPFADGGSINFKFGSNADPQRDTDLRMPSRVDSRVFFRPGMFSSSEIEAEQPCGRPCAAKIWVGRVAMRLGNEPAPCEFTNTAVVELTRKPSTRKFVGYHTEYRDWLATLVARREREADSGDSVIILLKGSRTSRQSVGPAVPSLQFQSIAEANLESLPTIER